MEAARQGHSQIVELLVEYRADVTYTSTRGLTAADWARKNGHINIAKRLYILHNTYKMQPKLFRLIAQ